MATLLSYVRSVGGGGGGGALTRNAQTSGRPVKDQRALNRPKPAYFLPNSERQSCSRSYGQRIEYETRCPYGSVLT